MYAYIHKQNQLTKVRFEIPVLMKGLRSIQEENTRLEYEIERFEHPIHLMNLSKQPEFSHLEHPTLDETVVIKRKSHIK